MKLVKINNTLCFVTRDTNKVIGLIQDGKYVKDPLRIRFFQHYVTVKC
jgi:hypothetical protein